MEKYYDPASAGSYGGIDPLYRELKTNKKEIQNWLITQDAYTIHKPARKNYPRNKIIASWIDTQWEADLVDLQKIAKFNDNKKYLVTVIDVVSKYAWVHVLKNKTGGELVKAFQEIFDKSNRKPEKLRTDAGTEFTNHLFQKFLKKNTVAFFTVYSDMKAMCAERFNRTLKSMMWRYFTAKQTYRYIDILSQMVHSYNSRYHSSIKMAPKYVKPENVKSVLHNLYGHLWSENSPINYKFQIGDLVRVSTMKAPFTKAYRGQWSQEIFKVHKRFPRQYPVYKITDLNGEVIKGSFYEPELQYIQKDLDGYFEVENVIKTRRNPKTKKKEYFVKWKSYPESFNSWVSNIRPI